MNIKNRAYYFYDDLIKIKDFDPKLLKLDKKSYKSIDTYYIGHKYVIPLYLLAHRINSFIEEQTGNKYLNIDFTDSNNKVLKNRQKFGVELNIKLRR